jgi:hypothetical protein
VLGWLLLAFGRAAARSGRRHATEVLSALDELRAGERLVLFLRSFVDDEGFARQQSGPAAMDYWGTTRTEEEQLVWALAPFGRMVTFGRPGETLPQVGAARYYVSVETWQVQLLAALDRADLVVLAAGPGRSLRWEVDQIVARGQPERLIIVVSRDSQQYRDFRESMGPSFPRGLPFYQPVGPAHVVGADAYTRAAVWFDSDWTPQLRHLDGRGVPGSVRNWVGSTFSHAMAPVYSRAGATRPDRLAGQVRKLVRRWNMRSRSRPRAALYCFRIIGHHARRR